MKRILHVCALLALILGVSVGARAQSAYPYAFAVPNDPTTGTTQFTLTKINSSGNAVIMATTDTNGFAGVCVGNCGKTGSAWIAFAGLVPVLMENTATAQHYVIIGSTTGGDGHDSGATTYPGAVGDVVGRIQIGAAAAAYAMVQLAIADNVSGTQTIASGTVSLGTSAIASGACSSANTVSATGVATTDIIIYNPDVDPTSTTGYAPSASGTLYIWAYPTANNVNFKVCNSTSASITPGAITFNWRVTR